MPAFFKKSRRDDGVDANDSRGAGVDGVLDAVVWASAGATSAARFAQRSSHPAMSYPREYGLPTRQD
jgi:hypothetical protein